MDKKMERDRSNENLDELVAALAMMVRTGTLSTMVAHNSFAKKKIGKRKVEQFIKDLGIPRDKIVPPKGSVLPELRQNIPSQAFMAIMGISEATGAIASGVLKAMTTSESLNNEQLDYCVSAMAACANLLLEVTGADKQAVEQVEEGQVVPVPGEVVLPELPKGEWSTVETGNAATAITIRFANGEITTLPIAYTESVEEIKRQAMEVLEANQATDKIPECYMVIFTSTDGKRGVIVTTSAPLAILPPATGEAAIAVPQEQLHHEVVRDLYQKMNKVVDECWEYAASVDQYKQNLQMVGATWISLSDTGAVLDGILAIAARGPIMAVVRDNRAGEAAVIVFDSERRGVNLPDAPPINADDREATLRL